MNWLDYANQSATRNQPLAPKLVNALSFLPDMGVTMKVFSGGQDEAGPHHTGSHRHDHGNAADVFFYKDGRQLDWANPQDVPLFEQIVQRGKAAGVTGFGAGDGYMRPGSMHIGFGSPAVWGAGGAGSNAPGWLRSAFNGQAAPLPPPSPYAGLPDGQKGQEVYTPPPSQETTAGILPPAPHGIIGDPSLGSAVSSALNPEEKSPLQQMFAGLAQYPDAPTPRLGPMGDARQSGGDLLKLLSSLKKRG